MRIRVAGVSVLVVSLCLASPGLAQISMQPTPAPTVTAESHAWYSSGEPIAYGGTVYYPSGPVTHFLRNEMVPTGMFDGVEIYARTTVEPGSVIFVPLAGGLMRPYERRRSGDLAGTVGSSAPSFPVVLPGAPDAQASLAYVQAPRDTIERPVGTSGYSMSRPAAPHAPSARELIDTGGAATVFTPPAPAVQTPLQTARRPVGLNGVFVQFENARWFASGPAVELRPERMTRRGEYRGFPVYAENDRRDIIYVPVLSGTNGAPGLLTPYRAR